MSKKTDNTYYKIYYHSSTTSFTNIYHTIDDVAKEMKRWGDDNGFFGAELTVTAHLGWDEQERKELERLKSKYEAKP